MFIGQLLGHPYTNNMGAIGAKLPAASNQISPPRYDRAEIGIHSQTNIRSGIYAPNPNQMQALKTVPAVKAVPDSRLQAELLPPSERTSYTEDDALLNQYMKQSRIDGYFDGGTFVRTSSGPVGLILKDPVTSEELHKFNSELAEKGLGDEIDWRGVKNDFVQIGVGFDNIERFEQKTDYLTSRYAVLKDRIQSQFTGDKQEAELQKLEQIYTEAKEKMANSYAGSIGGFYESLGQSGAAEDMRNSVLALIDQKANAYTDHIAKEGIGVSITAPDQQWLMQDDAYLAARLRENASVSSAELKMHSVSGSVPYNGNDLSFAGIYAKSLSQQLQHPAWNVDESDAALGRHLALQYGALTNDAEKAGISERLSNLLTSSFSPFMERLMDSLDAVIDRNREWVAENPWMADTLRTDYIDRKSVNEAFLHQITALGFRREN